MVSFIVNDDITYYLCYFLPIKDLFAFGQTCKNCYYITRSISLYKELVYLRNCKKPLQICYTCNLLQTLKTLKRDNHSYHYEGAADDAASNGCVQILGWLFAEHNSLVYSKNAINNALGKGYIHVLQWFLDSSLEFKCSESQLEEALLGGNIQLLDWILHSGLRKIKKEHCDKYYYVATNNDRGLSLINTEQLLINAAVYNQLSVLNWIISVNLPIQISDHFISYAARKGHLKILDWALKYCWNDAFIHPAIDSIGYGGNVQSLDWFVRAGKQLDYCSLVIDSAAANNHVVVLDWFKTSGLEFKYSSNAIDDALKNNHWRVLHWFSRSNYPLKYTTKAIYKALQHNKPKIIHWIVSTIPLSTILLIQKSTGKILQTKKCVTSAVY